MTYKKYVEIMTITMPLLFNRSIKSNMRFLSKTSKLSILLTTYIVLVLLRDGNLSERRTVAAK